MVSPALQGYISRMKGQRYDPSRLKITPKPPSRIAVLVSSFVGSFTGIAILALLTYNVQFFIDKDVPVLAGSFGASAVLIYGAIEAPLSQPRNVIGGHIMASLIGVSLYKLFNLLSDEMFHRLHWLLCSLAVALSLMCMQLTHTVHPPASASALIAVSGGQSIYDLGYLYVLCPIALGVALMMIVAMLVNNVVRKYPVHWWNPKARMITIIDQDMATTIADFVAPEDEDEDEDDEDQDQDIETIKEGQAQGKEQERKSEQGQGEGQEQGQSSEPIQASSSRSTLFDSPSTASDQLGNANKITVAQPRPSSPSVQFSPEVGSSSSPRLHHHHHNHQQHPLQPQFAVYYGGEKKKELKDGAWVHEEPGPPNDMEQGHGHDHGHGHGHTPRRSSIVVEMRGTPHPPHSPNPSHMSEENCRQTIEQLQLRIQELENQLASTSK
ncbi:hypothetical protein BG011_005664 [Mortierella polycephala]|uniref:HPP transmembrane region domain-containing protein n=1 Tax=Mortierella polycephala TaxID=41804 RepID=A0A9P6U0Z0_9FUNG|nr:hypothetical protein BG011_005664 [Mortierella polycephala]